MASFFKFPRWGRSVYQKVENPYLESPDGRLLEPESSRASEETIHPAESSPSSPHHRRRKGYTGIALSLVITNLVTAVLWLTCLHRANNIWLVEDSDTPPDYLGAAQVPINYETLTFSHIPLEQGPNGTHKADSFWHKILSVGLMRLTADQAALGGLGDGKTAREWQTADSYVGVLGVFHQLHCLARVRYALLFPGRMEKFDGADISRKHLSHCLDYLRQIIMCHGDVTVEPVGWNGTTLTYIAVPEKMDIVRQCRKFDDIYKWAVDDAHQVPHAPGNEKSFREMIKFEDSHPRHGRHRL